VSAGNGLTGGGSLATDQTFSLDPASGLYIPTPPSVRLPIPSLISRPLRFGSSNTTQAIGLTITNVGAGWAGSTVNANDLRQSSPREQSSGAGQQARKFATTANTVFRGQFAKTGGFLLVWRVAFPTVPSDARILVGITATDPGATDPSSKANTVGFAADTGDTNFQLLNVSNGGTIQKTALSTAKTKANLAVGDPNTNLTSVYEFRLWADPNDSVINAWAWDWGNDVSLQTVTQVPVGAGALPLNTTGLIPIYSIHSASTCVGCILDFWGYW